MPVGHPIEVITLSSDDVTHSSPFVLRRAQSPDTEGALPKSTILGGGRDRDKSKGGSSCSWCADSDVFPELDIGSGRNIGGGSKELGIDGEDPTSSWIGLPQLESPKASSLPRVEKEHEVIIIGDSPEKQPTHSALPAIAGGTAFSSTTTEILENIWGANRGSGGRISSVIDTQVESIRRPIKRQRRSATSKDENQELDLPPTRQKRKARSNAPSGAISLEEGVPEKGHEVIVTGDSSEKPPTHSALPAIADKTAFSSETTEILANILGVNRGSNDGIGSVIDTQSIRRPIKRKRYNATSKDENQEPDLPPTKQKTKARSHVPSGDISLERGAHKKGSRLTEQEREKRLEDKVRKAASRDAEKEAKRLEKETKALERQNQQELDAVNKLKTSKKDSVKEIIVDISTSFAQSPKGQLLVKFLDNQQQESTTDWDTSLPNLIKWRRKVVSSWDETLGYFVPTPLHIRDEKHVLVVLLADEFVDMAEDEALLGDHVVKLKSALGEEEAIPIYLIEGLTALMQKSQNAKNRTFQGAVRQAINSASTGGDASSGGSCSSSRGKKGRTRIIDDDTVEDALLRLQITHRCLIHHTTSAQGTLEWIYIFTGDISTIPYKKARMNFDTSFCADVGQVRAGHDVDDTFSKMLQEFHRVTAGVANSIMAEYKTVRQLMDACTTLGDSVVSDLEVMAAGLGTGRKIGQATSRRIHRFFVARGEDGPDPGFC